MGVLYTKIPDKIKSEIIDPYISIKDKPKLQKDLNILKANINLSWKKKVREKEKLIKEVKL